jgi:hypothetical protein
VITLRIELADDRSWFLPGGLLEGRASWRLDEPPEAVELRLFWHTSGKGTEDVEIVDVRRFGGPGPHGEESFAFTLPLGPYSFSGSLITLAWALELIALPGGETERLDMVVAPTPVEVRLTSLGRRPTGQLFTLGKRTK